MNKKFFIIVVITVVLSSIAFLMPEIGAFSDQMALAFSVAILIPQAIAMWYFITSLKAFRKELRIAYSILAVGILIFGLVQLQLPLETFAPLDPILSAWLTVIPALLGAIIIFVGVRKFAKLLEVNTIWKNWLFALGLAALLAFLSSLVPHIDAGVSEELFDGIFGTYIAAGAFSFVSAMLVLQIRHKISITYKAAMGWLAAALFTATLACLHETFIRTVGYSLFVEDYFSYGYSLWIFLVAALLFVKASLSFRATSIEFAEMPDNPTYLDVINYMAQKASNPTAIDVTLDKVRQMTASYKTGSEISAGDQSTFVGVYRKIETYLTTEEPLRTYTKESLRAELPDNFKQALITQEAPKPKSAA